MNLSSVSVIPEVQGVPLFERRHQVRIVVSPLARLSFKIERGPPGRAKLLLSREPETTYTRQLSSAGDSPSRRRRSPIVSVDEELTDPRVEHPYVPPVALVLFNKGQVIRGDLIQIVRRFVGEHDMQRDMIHAVVDRTGELIPNCSRREEDHAGLHLQILLAGVHEGCDLGWRGIFKSEKDIVSEHVRSPMVGIGVEVWRIGNGDLSLNAQPSSLNLLPVRSQSRCLFQA